MRIIPVIDLMGGIVVRAKLGQRSQYRRLESTLTRSADAIDVVRGFLTVAPFSTFYIADLDAICGSGNNRNILVRLKRIFPFINFWIDCGIRSEMEVNFASAIGDPVIGSECQTSSSLLHYRRDVLLSLDFRGPYFIGPPCLLEEPALWPERIIVMSLERVGSETGPDLDRIRSVKTHLNSHQIYAAGGVRGTDDLVQLKQLGVHGVLVASALHDGMLFANDFSLGA